MLSPSEISDKPWKKLAFQIYRAWENTDEQTNIWKKHFVQGCSSKTLILQSNVNKYQASTKALIYSFTNENVFSVNAVF